MKNKIFFGCLMLLLFLSTPHAISHEMPDYPVVGKPCPDFLLTDVHGKPGHTISLKDLRGKYVILDFWSTGCITCITSFPKLYEIQNKYADDLEIILIGKDDKYIRDAYARYSDKYQVNLNSTYNKELFDRFGIRGVPFIVMLDTEGIVKAVSGSFTSEDVEKLIGDGQDLKLLEPFWYNKNNIIANTRNQIDSNVLFNSTLTMWQEDMETKATTGFRRSVYVNGRTFEVKGQDIGALYRYAFFDPIPGSTERIDSYMSPVFELNDSTRIYKNKRYCYTLIVPEEHADGIFMMNKMQNDLKDYFMLDAFLEERNVPCYYVKAAESAESKLKTKGGSVIGEWQSTGIHFENLSFEDVLSAINGQLHPNEYIVDLTDFGEEFKVDIKLDALMLDMEDMQRALKDYGLILYKGTRKGKILVLRDSIDVQNIDTVGL